MDSNQSNDSLWESIENELLDPFQIDFERGKKDGHIAGLKSGYREGWYLGHLKAVEIGIELGYIHGFAKQLLDKNYNQDENHNHTDKNERRLRELITLIERFPTPHQIFPNVNNNSNVNHNHYDDDYDSNGVVTTDLNPNYNATTTIINNIKDCNINDGTSNNMYNNDQITALKNDETHNHDHHQDDSCFVNTTNSHPTDQNELPNNNHNSSSSSSTPAVVDIKESLQRIRAKFQTILVQYKQPHCTLTKIMNHNHATNTYNETISKSKQHDPSIISDIGITHDNNHNHNHNHNDNSHGTVSKNTLSEGNKKQNQHHDDDLTLSSTGIKTKPNSTSNNHDW